MRRYVLKKGRMFLELGVALTRKELFYDIEFITNRIAKMTAVDEKRKLTRQAADVTAEGDENKDYLDRLITTALAKIRTNTSWASGERGQKHVSDVIPDHVCNWTFVFHLDKDWRGEGETVCSLCHDYVVHKVATDWLKMVAPNLAGEYEVQADEDMRDLKFELRKESSVNPPVLYHLTGESRY